MQPVDTFEPCCLATTLGSLPHTDVVRGTELMFASTPEIPAWVQFPKRDYFDAYAHVQAIALYPAELRAFLERGGCLGLGDRAHPG